MNTTICQGTSLSGLFSRRSPCLVSTGALDVWACKHTPANTNAHPTVVRVEKMWRSPVDSIRKESDRRVWSQPARPADTAHSSLTRQSERRDHQQHQQPDLAKNGHPHRRRLAQQRVGANVVGRRRGATGHNRQRDASQTTRIVVRCGSTSKAGRFHDQSKRGQRHGRPRRRVARERHRVDRVGRHQRGRAGQHDAGADDAGKCHRDAQQRPVRLGAVLVDAEADAGDHHDQGQRAELGWPHLVAPSNNHRSRDGTRCSVGWRGECVDRADWSARASTLPKHHLTPTDPISTE